MSRGASPGGDFWSRRKAMVEAEAQADHRAADAREGAARDTELAEKTDIEICEALGLPDPDTLAAGDDFPAFMARAVPERLRRRALRRLWLSNPVLANVDGLVDYGEDFTDSATVIENLQTAYQVGRGMTAHVEEMARQAEADAQRAEETPEEITGDPDDHQDEASADMAETQAPAPQIPEPHIRDEATASDPDTDPPPRRRMRFAFDDAAKHTAKHTAGVSA